MNKLIKKILDLLFPKKCIGCGKIKEILCNKCLESFACGEKQHEDIFIATTYQDEVAKKAIWLLKYHGIKQLTEPLAKLIYDRVNIEKYLKGHSSNWLIIPIPLSKQRLKKRGFNQSELIGHHLTEKINNAGIMSVKLVSNVLYRKFDTPTQVSIKDKSKRLKNLKGSFDIRYPHLIKNKKIILIDDVSTTGATMTEGKRALKKYGANKIISIAVANG